MERGGPALELKLWAAQEMGLPPAKVPPDGAFRRGFQSCPPGLTLSLCIPRMCSGQCAEIWRYVTRHVHHQRNVKKIRGNLLWYQHLEEAEGKPSRSEPEQERRRQLAQGVARLRGELQQLDLQMETAQREVMADEISLEAAQERIRDAQRRSLLLKAYAARTAKERQQLQGSVTQLGGRLEQLQDISRKAKVELTVGGKVPDLRFAGVEPEVLRDVRTACQLRFHFLKSLFEHSTSGALPGTSEELLDASYQHWLSTVEDIVGSHPPNHVLAALEHLALENTLQLQELTSRIDIPRDVEALKFRYESARLEDLAGPPAALPSVRGLIHEGWSRCEELWVQQLPLQAREQHGTAQLASLVQEMHRLLADGSERAILARAVLELELRAVRLAGLRDGLHRGCRELEREVSARHAELQALQSKRQRILDFRHLVREKQQHVRALIKGTSYIKSQLRKDQAEVQAFVQRKLLGPEQDVTLESQRLHGGVEREVRQLGAIALPCLLRRSLLGSQQVPAHELSIHRLGRTALAQHRAFLTVCQASGFPLYKAPEHLLPHMAELKKELLALSAQLGYKSQALASLQQRQGSPGTDAQALVQALRDHDREQAGALGPRIRLVTEQCRQRIERWPEVQAAIDAWWEQPGQFALPAEHRLGLTLQQWLERWTLALKTLQRQQQQQHSWA
ncbi:HAUS augmin-like complex subunit 5 isoform X2 [Terrapene carolina triunguis]|uniref:HAUS augmin-like complex subunit 5 isoform X2 n=1 Tax=Terrapene triunguis TaxID=2587831 RepID=UPI001156827E|nr:HAUS augmin-like complex subunit 5 isoform X2 [Terrapene carolina triunguis]